MKVKNNKGKQGLSRKISLIISVKTEMLGVVICLHFLFLKFNLLYM